MPANPDALVTAAWLAAHIDDPDLRVLHCGSDDQTAAQYAHEHVRGAIYANGYSDFCEDREVRALAPSRVAMEQICARLGIGPEDNIVCYAPQRSMWPGRAYWVLRYYRFPNVHVLDGGIEALRAAGVPLTDASPGPQLPRRPQLPNPDESILATADQVLAAAQAAEVAGTPLILDCRSDGEFAGTADGRHAEARRGRIPRAAHVNWELLLTADGKFLPLEQLRALYAAAGIDGTRPVYPYCGGGIRASVGWIALHELLGYDSIANYDGSWAEWANRPDLPIEAG